ncbi:strawberry notch-like NTP hydrolase domain-containing protein [Palleronia caenipelagi]|nr:strawberry notch family protein [Palleronia caenipelagi]
MKRQTLIRLLTQIAGDITNGTLDAGTLSARLTTAAGGTDAAGAWSWRRAYDVMQAATILSDRKEGQVTAPKAGLTVLEALARTLPTETRRSETQIRLQQFSTPLPYAHVAAVAAGIGEGDIVLEPSAGTGALAHMAQRSGATLMLNEIDPFRAALLQILFGGRPTAHDGEHIDDLLQSAQQASVVLMNPPFSSSVSRKEDPTIALRHAISAAKRLVTGGRLVAILPRGACERRQSALWGRLTEIVTPRLHLGLPGIVYRKMGTSVDTALLVADRTPGGTQIDLHEVDGLRAALEVMDRELCARAEIDAALLRPETAPVPQTARAAWTPVRKVTPAATPAPRAVEAPLTYRERETPGENVAVSEIYARYAPQRIEIAGAVDHPSPLVESVAMAAVMPPLPHVVPSLPGGLVGNGALSGAQLETIIMAEDAHARTLPGSFTVAEDWTGAEPAGEGADGAVRYRQGFFLGDGTGAGKGRQAAGVILSNWLAGRQRAIWISKTKTLMEDAIRDWTDLGGSPADIHPIDRWKPDEAITLSRGILFLTYATLRSTGKSGNTRLQQIIDWAGGAYDGALIFDEAHAMQNAAGSSEGRGAAPSQQGLAGLRLQYALPRARVLYVSATGATHVGNLAYATRLGLWGAGEDYAFASREDFVSAMEAGGVAAMEVVARDLKALGLYTARALSFEGVEYDILEHTLSEDETRVYDAFGRAFKVIHQNLRKALEATGIEDKEAGISASAAKASALSRFESMKQRFFSHILNGFKARSLIPALEADLAEGWAPVIQIVSTGESHLDRALDRLEAGDDLTEAHLTPKGAVVHWLETAFPVEAHQLIEVDGQTISQPLLDAEGNRVISREAVALRDAALNEIYTIAPIPSVLDRLIWHFGEKRVAEVTGRSKRPVRTASGQLKIAPRSASANSAESAAYMAGAKQILIFSDAGGTGRSYHAARTAGNTARRRHYLVEPGWRADAAIQGLGRTHRSNQVSAPFFRVVTTNVHGEKRFTSTIARRLDTLGALTRGQRQTGSQNMFRASDNLESPIARRALIAHYRDLASDRCDAMSYDTFTEWTALKLTDREGVMLEDLPPIQRYLNRLLALPIHMQNALFAAFSERIEAQTEAARARGTLDVGIETLRADRIRVTGEDDLWTCPKSGSVTRMVTLQTESRLTYPSGAGILSDYRSRFAPMRNAASGKVAMISKRPQTVYDDDSFADLRELRRPTGRWSVLEEEFGKSHWEPVDPGRFVALWDAEVADLPTSQTEEIVLLTGLLLPIWTSIPSDNERIWRVLPEDHPSLIGRAITPQQAVVLRGRFGAGQTDRPEDIVAIAQSGEASADLGQGMTLCTRRVAGAPRLEVQGFAPGAVSALKGAGCFTEIIAHQLRVFVPVGPEAAEVVARIKSGAAAPSGA